MDIYLARAEERNGPYSMDSIRQFLADGELDGTELAWHEGLDEWININEMVNGVALNKDEPTETQAAVEAEPSDEETLEQVNKIKELIGDGHEETARTLVRSLNNPKIYEGLLKDCPVDEDGSVCVPEYLSENVDLFIKLLGNIPEAKFQQFASLNLSRNQITDISALAELINLENLDLSYCDGLTLNQIFELKKALPECDIDYNNTTLNLDADTVTQVNKIKELISDGHEDKAWQLIQSLNNLNIYGGLLKGCRFDFDQMVIAPEYLYSHRDLFVKLLANRPSNTPVERKLNPVKNLSLSCGQITDISALKELTQLTELDLSSNEISDVSALAGLEKLTYLDLSNNQITDIGALAELINLEKLELGVNQISDVGPLKDLTQLTELDLSDNQITNISALAELINLEKINLGGTFPESESNQISDISALAELINLEKLMLGGNQISDVSPLARLHKLDELWLSYNKISDVSALAGLRMSTICLSNNQITDVSALAELKSPWRFWNINLNNNQITDVSALSGLTGLMLLELNDNPNLLHAEIAELQQALPDCEIRHNARLSAEETAEVIEAAIRKSLKKPTGELTKTDLERVTELDLSESNLINLSALAKLTRLEKLDLSNNRITDITSLAGLTQLTELTLLNNNELVDVSSLAGLTQLTKLNLSCGRLTDISALANLTQLELLICSGTLCDLTPLAGLTRLRVLSIWGCGITDVSALARLTQLEKLDLGINNITDVSPLAGLTQLKVLSLKENYELTDVGALAGLPKLEKIYLMETEVPGNEINMLREAVSRGSQLKIFSSMYDDGLLDDDEYSCWGGEC